MTEFYAFILMTALFLAGADPASKARELADAGRLASEAAAKLAPPEPTPEEAQFLDRLMLAESGGRLDAKNPRSSALGPFQFIHSTFHELMSRHFPDLTAAKSYAELQQLRTDLEIARKAALLYTRENAAYLAERGVKPEPEFLRLAFLLGPGGAHSVISAQADTPVAHLLAASAIEANPFMQGMTAEQLIARARREADGLKPLKLLAAVRAVAPRPQVKVRCDLSRPSCRKWLALAKRRVSRKVAKK